MKINKVGSTYGPKCLIYYGNWSRQKQWKGDEPSPTSVGFRKEMSKRFNVDEFRTSKTCNRCMGELKSYIKRDGKRSYVVQVASVQTTDKSASSTET